MEEMILILDFGSQYTQLIARKVREINVYCEIKPYNAVQELPANVKGIILSGSPSSVNDADAPVPAIEKWKGKVPILGVCYGAQFMAQHFGGRLWAELPPLVYGAAARDALEQEILSLPACVQDAVCSNVGSVLLAQKAGLRVHGGFELNVLNSEAAEEYRIMGLEDVTLSPELAFAKMRRMRGEMPRGALIYGYLPLMKCRACPGRTEKGCGNCTGLSELTDRTGAKFPLICRDKQYSEILNCVPLYAGDRAVPKLDFEELYFTVETKEECRRVWELWKEKFPADFPRTAGLYFRELL